MARPVPPLGPPQDSRHLRKNDLPVPKSKEINEIPEWFRVGDRNASGTDDGLKGIPLSGI